MLCNTAYKLHLKYNFPRSKGGNCFYVPILYRCVYTNYILNTASPVVLNNRKIGKPGPNVPRGLLMPGARPAQRNHTAPTLTTVYLGSKINDKNKYISPDPSSGRKRQVCSRASKWNLKRGS